MYDDEKLREDHFKDFSRIYERLKNDKSCNEYRLSIVKSCMDRCKLD